MSLTINKNFSRFHCHTDSQMNIKLEKNRTSSSPFLISFEHHILSNIYQYMPIIIKTLDKLSQILDDYPLTQTKFEQIHQGTIDSILWNEDQSEPIAIDQNNYLIEFRQLIRKLIYEFLEFTQQILIINNKNNEINIMIEKSISYLITLNNYRIKRQSAYNYFCQNSKSKDAISILNNIDKQQYHQLHLIALYLRELFSKLISYSFLE